MTFENFQESHAATSTTCAFGLPNIPEVPQDTQNPGPYSEHFLNSTRSSVSTEFPNQHAWGGAWDFQRPENEMGHGQSLMGAGISTSSASDLSSPINFDIQTSPSNSSYVYEQSFSSNPSLVSSSSNDWQLPNPHLSPTTPESHYAGSFNSPYADPSSSGQFFSTPYPESSM